MCYKIFGKSFKIYFLVNKKNINFNSFQRFLKTLATERILAGLQLYAADLFPAL